MGGEVSRTCGICGVTLSETNMMKHLKACQKLHATVTRPDGYKLEFEYKGASTESVSSTMNKAITYR